MSDRRGISPNILNLLNSLDAPVGTTYRDTWRARQEQLLAEQQALQTPVVEEGGRSWGDVGLDIGKGLAKGVNSVGGSIVQTVDAAGRALSTIDPIGQTVAYLAPEFTAKTNAMYDQAVSSTENALAENQEHWQRQKSQGAQDNAAYISGGDGFVDTAARIMDRPQAIPDVIADSAAYLAPGAWVSRAMAAAKASMAAVTGATMATGAVLDAGATGAQAKREVLEMTPAQLIEQSPDYKAMLGQGIAPEAAQAELARSAGFTAQALQLPMSFLASKLTGAGKLETEFFTGTGARNFFSSVAKEVGEETVQEGAAQANQNAGVKLFADEGRKLNEGVGNSAALGAVTGGAQGAGIKAVGALVPRSGGPVSESEIDHPTNGEQPASAAGELPAVPASPIVHTGDPSNPDDTFKFELNQDSFVSGLRARIDANRAEAARAQAAALVEPPDTDLASAARSYGEQQGYIAPAPMPVAAALPPDVATPEETLIPGPAAASSLGGLPDAAGSYREQQEAAAAAADSQRFQAAFNENTAYLDQDVAPFAAARAIGTKRRDADIDSARNARMPENMRDTRLLRARYRDHLNNVSGSLDSNGDVLSNIDSLLDFAAKNGGLNAEAWAKEGIDPADAKSINAAGFEKAFRKDGGMTPDDLAELASQNGYRGFANTQGTPDSNAALNAVNDELRGAKQHYSTNDESKLQAAQAAPKFLSELKGFGTPETIKSAINNALAGKPLGSNQLKIVQEILDGTNTHTRDNAAIREKWDVRAKAMLANRGNKELKAWRNRDEHDQDVTTHEAALHEIMTDAVQHYGIEPAKIHAAYDKYHAKYPKMNQFVVAMQSWVSANKQDSSEQPKYDGQEKLSGRSSGGYRAAAPGPGLPSISEGSQAQPEAGRTESAAPGESGGDSQGRDTGLRQPVAGWDKSLIKARFAAKALDIPNYATMKLAELVPAIHAKTKGPDPDERASSPTKKLPESKALRDVDDTDVVESKPVKAESIEGRDIDGDWVEFSDKSGTIGVPRAEMPQIKAEHRGAMVNFLNARDIAHQEEVVPAESLKPTQKEFSREKVLKAAGFEGGSRSILVSEDNHVLDGHHQWLANRDKGEDVKVIRLKAPIKELLEAAHEFPSSTTDTTSETRLDADERGLGGRLTTDRQEPLTQKGTALAEKADIKIQDFGQTLEGAKKHTASLRETLSDKTIDIASVPLSKSFPTPDYEKLAAAGVSPEVLAFIAQLRGEIKSKPRRSVKQWADSVEQMRSFANDLLVGTITPARLIETMRSRNSYVRNLADVIALANEILPSQIKDLASYKLEEHHYSIYRDEKNVNKWVVTNTAEKGGAFSRGGKETHFDTKAEALAFIKSKVSITDTQGKSLVKFDVWSVRGQEGVWIGKKLGARKYIELKKFDTSAEARAFIVSNNDELVDMLKDKKRIGSERRAEQNERVGKDYRRGVNVTQDLFNETFGFRGVQFGNYVENDRRQQDLNNAYDGLLDLADVLGIPSQAISLNGELGLAFGARGNGGKDAASAHYEPGGVVINLTKANGAGSLAHEWWHAMDNYFAKAGDLSVKRDSAFLTELNRPVRKEVVQDGRRTMVNLDPAEFGVRPEVYDAFKSIIKTIRTDTQLYQRSAVLDGRKTSDYWSTTRELTARAFERFVIDELEAKGYESDYLATILPKDTWDATESFWGNIGESYPYPTDEEATKTTAAYRALFDVIETAETDKGTLLYSLADKSDSIAGDSRASISEHDAHKVIIRIRAGLVDSSIKIEAVRDFSEFPAAIKSYAEKNGDDNRDIKGVFHKGSIYLNMSAHKDAMDLERTLLHELYGHYGLRTLFGKDIRRIMSGLYLAMGGSRAIYDMAKKHGHDLSQYEDMLKDAPVETYMATMAEELLAHIAQDNRPGVKRYLKELVGALRSWLRAKGFLQLSSISESEIYRLLKLARNAATKSEGGSSLGGTMYSFGVAKYVPGLRGQVLRAEQKSSLPPSLQDSYGRLGQDKTIVDRVLSEVKRQLTPAGLLPKEVFNLKVSRDGEMNANELHARHTLQGFYDAIEAAYGMPYANLKAGTKREINKVLRGDQNAQLAPSVIQALGTMRDDIKKLSHVHVRQLIADAAELKAQGKDTAAENIMRMVDTISQNFDTYLNRSYRAFDDKKWPSKVPAKVYKEAVDFLASEYAGTGPVTADHIKKAEKRTHMILHEGTAFDSMGAFITESKLGAKDLSIMKKRKDVPAPIRALLGEYEDAAMNYTKSVTKMSRLVHNHAFLGSMKEVAFALGLLHEKQNTELGATKKIAGESTDSYAPLNGLYTTREFEQALKDALGKSNPSAIYDVIVAANGMVKFGKTVLSPTTAMRNITSSMFFALTNGHFDVKQFAKSAQVMRVYFSDKGPTATKQYMEKLQRLGVIYDSPMAGEMMDLLKDARLENTLMNSGNPLLNSTKGALEWAQKFYSAGDDIYKVMGFENEKAMLMKHKKMSEAEAEEEAAERIRNTYPTYSMIGRGVNTLRRFPLVGAFVSFPAEIIRTSYNITGYLYKDAKELGITNPMVMRKLIGYAIAAGAIGAIQALSAAWQGVDEDEEKALRLMAPQFSKNSNYLWLWRDEKGNRRYVDLSFLDPYNYWKRPINAVLQDQPLGEALQSGVSDMLSPFFGWDIAAKAIGESTFNQKSGGGEIYNPADSAASIAGDIGKHLGKALQPGVFVNIENFYMALAGQQSKSGKVYNLPDETAALLGWRASTFDPKVALFYQSYSYQDAKSNASKILKSAASDNNHVDDADIKSAYKSSMEARAQAFDDMETIVSAAKKTGLTNLQILGVLRDSGTSIADARALIAGKPPVFTPSKAMMKGAIKKAAVLFDAETQREMKARQKLIDGLNRDALAGRLSYVDE